jgi:hypothetical protein
MLGLKINFLKSEVYCLAGCVGYAHIYEEIFTHVNLALYL